MSQPLQFRTTGVAPNQANPLAADDLHRWRLRATSVRISFVDHANGERGFRYVNANTGAILGNQLPPTAGTGRASIGQINGLRANTTYTIRVHTLFNNGRATAISEPISFRTLAQ